jgi:hypothetical protein
MADILLCLSAGDKLSGWVWGSSSYLDDRFENVEERRLLLLVPLTREGDFTGEEGVESVLWASVGVASVGFFFDGDLLKRVGRTMVILVPAIILSNAEDVLGYGD